MLVLLASLALFHAHPLEISLGMVFIGIGVPFAFAAMAKLIVDAVRPSETGVATGMNTVMRTIGSVMLSVRTRTRQRTSAAVLPSRQ